MALANGLILAVGGLLIGIPIILHFLMQPKPKPLVFPALRFISSHHRTNKRQMRLKHLLLLLLRCLLILILAAALARPSTISNTFGSWVTVGSVGFLALIIVALLLAAIFWAEQVNKILVGVLAALLFGCLAVGGVAFARTFDNSGGQIIGDVKAPIAAALIVDTSPRMEYRSENATSLDRAKETGQWLTRQFPADSSVSVIATDSDPPFFSVDIGAANKRLETLEIRYADTGIPDTIGPAIQLLESAEQKRKELYILTDMTAQSWVNRQDRKVLERLREANNVDIYLIDVGVLETQNFRLSEPRMVSSSITQSGQLEIQVDVSRRGPAASRGVNLLIEKPDPTRPVRRDGKTLVPEEYWKRSQTVDLDDDSTNGVQFQIGDLGPGIHHGRIELEGTDSLAVDNVRHFTISVRPAWKALVVRPQGVNAANLIEAIAPEPERKRGVNQFDCTVVDQRDINQVDFNDYRVVFFLDPKPLTEATWEALESFVSSGGGLGVFLGRNAGKNGWAHAEFVSEAAQRVLPGEITDVWRRPDGDLHLNPSGMTHPIMADFRESATSIAWDRLPVFKHWGIQASSIDPNAAIEVIVRFSNEQPAVIEKILGRGRVILMTTPISESARMAGGPTPWNNLIQMTRFGWPSWLLVRQIGFHLATTEQESLNYEIGQTATLPNDERTQPEDYRIYTPRDEDPGKLTATDGRLRYRFTDTPGSYRIKGVLSGPVIRGFSVNLSPIRTQMERMTAEQLDDILGKDRYQLARDQSEIQRKQGNQRMGQEFYPLLIILLVIILVLELLMSNYFYRDRATEASRSSIAAKFASST